MSRPADIPYRNKNLLHISLENKFFPYLISLQYTFLHVTTYLIIIKISFAKTSKRFLVQFRNYSFQDTLSNYKKTTYVPRTKPV